MRILAVALLVAVPSFGVASCGSSSPSAPSAKSCTIAAPDRTDWRLRADRTHFRDGLGRVVVLRGVDAGGRSKFAPFVPFDYAPGAYDAALASYMDRAAAWGIDAMRVPFTWAAVEPTQGMDDEDFLVRYGKLLDAAWARGIWTVVDMHQDVYAEVFCGDGFPGWTVPDPKPAPHHDCANWGAEYLGDTAMQAAFDRFWASGSPIMTAYLAMWDRVVARFKDHPGVVGFEPINEPGWGTADIATFESTTLSTFYASIVMRMRAAAPTSLVFIDPTGFAGVVVKTTLVRPPGDGVVFAPHFYPLGAASPDNVEPKMQTWADLGATWGTPTFVGEFGMSHDAAGAADYMGAHFDALDALGLSGTEWEYSVAAEPWNLETDGLVAADGTEYPVAAAVLRPFARAVAGDGITTSFDSTKRVFSLTFTPSASSVTEVSLPARAFPSGYDLSLAGGCVDATHPGSLMVQSDPGANTVDLRVTGH
jgi:endoglycosylceramidase